MFSRKSISALLTGASLAALAATTGRATAATTTLNQPVVDWTTNVDWLNIETGSDVGTFTNSATIGDGLGNPDSSGALGVHVRDGATIGSFINDGTIFAIESGGPIFNNTTTAFATATGLLVDGNLSSVTNNGTLNAFAFGVDIEIGDATAEARAAGVVFDFDDAGDPTTANVDNTGVIGASASAQATSADDEARAYARAYGIEIEFDDRDEVVSSTVTNDNEIDVSVSAQADGETGAWANAAGDGIQQDFDNVDGGVATALNNGSILIEGESRATSLFEEAFAETNVDGIDQSVEADETAGLMAIVEATNAGSMTVVGTASAEIVEGAVGALAEVAGIEQDAENGLLLSSAEATNLGDLNVFATASVSAFAATYAGAEAGAVGIHQDVDGAYDGLGAAALAIADNQASILVSAVATASGTYVGDGYGLGAAVAMAAGIDQGVFDAELLAAEATNSGSLDVIASAAANFDAGTYSAAVAFGAGVNQQLEDGEIAMASFVNTGSLSVLAEADNTFEYDGIGYAMAIAGGASQSIYDVDAATASLENAAGAFLGVTAMSGAQGLYAMAGGMAIGLSQSVYAGSSADLTAGNLGTLMVSASANAEATYLATASVAGVGIGQSGDADSTFLDASNSGDLTVFGTATASTTEGLYSLPGIAVAGATYVGGIAQSAYGGEQATASAMNSGSIGVLASADAAASTYAMAYSQGFGVMQYVRADSDALAVFQNTGTVSVLSASGAQSDYVAAASARASGVDQRVNTSDGANTSAVAALLNDDTIFAEALAGAGGLTADQATYAAANASALGVYQEAWGASVAQTQLKNNGTIAAIGVAEANGNIATAAADAAAYVAEVEAGDDSTMVFRNTKTGAIWAIADAEATGETFAGAEAEALGAGFFGYAYDGNPTQIDAVNKGLIAASAFATVNGAPTEGWAYAEAMGVAISSWEGLGGTFKNGGKGMILANAFASGPNSYARAVGLEATSYDNGIHILNNGLIIAYAEGAEAMATGISLGSMSVGVGALPPPTSVATIENHGDIWAGISTDGGNTVLRGNAINTQYAYNPVTILLENDSPANIFGNIEISDDDQIIVQNGKTKFDGVINPDMMLEGSLTIRSKGTLVMLNNNDEEGPSHAYVDTFKMGKKGKLQLNLTPDNSPGAYPTINANTANLGGKLKAKFTPTFYDDKTVYEDVIAAETRNGKFNKVVDNSVLLDVKAVYDNNNNVDLKVKRVAFGDVPGLTKNQSAAGDGIEKVYGKLPNNGPFSSIVQDLFTLNGAQYAAAMDQLAGAEYAQLMQSVLRSTSQLNASVTDRMDCAIDPNLLATGADARKGCFDPNKVQVWARVGGSWNNSDGDVEAPGYSEDQASIYVGGDYAINTNVFVGVAGGYFNSSLDFDDWGGRDGASMSYDGGQIALYGGYDDGIWYGRNILSYGFYSGDSRREFGITSAPRSLTGDYNTNVVSYYGEAGRRFQLMENVGATPFLGLGLASAGIDSFKEKDPHGTGAALGIRGTDSNSVATTLGFRVNGYWGGFRPELTLAWRHEFADARQTVDMSYAGAPNGGNFSVVSSDPGSDALIVGLGASYAIAPSSVISLRYDGEFWSGYNAQQLSARWTAKF